MKYLASLCVQAVPTFLLGECELESEYGLEWLVWNGKQQSTVLSDGKSSVVEKKVSKKTDVESLYLHPSPREGLFRYNYKYAYNPITRHKKSLV
jgi:hypothetical protein